MDGIAQTKQWRKKLQPAFLNNSLPPESEFPTYDAVFTEIEAFDMTSEHLIHSKLHVILEHISELPDIPREEEFHFKQRAATLVEKWRVLPDSPVLSPEVKARLAEKAARLAKKKAAEKTPAQKMAERRAAELARLSTPTVVMLCRTTTPPHLAHEILTHIFKCGLDAAIPGRKWDYRRELEWRAEVNVLMSCALVTKDWSAAANRLLYTGRINLQKRESIQLLYRTIEASKKHCLIQHLHFSCYQREELQSELQSMVSQLLVRCTNLCYLEGELGAIAFTSSTQLPTFESLQFLAISNQDFTGLAPLMHRLPNLRTLDVLYFKLESQPTVRRVGAPRDRGSVPDFPAPIFQLDSLYLSQCDSLSFSHWKWLLSSSTSIKYAQLQEIRDGSAALAEVIGPAVQSLHLKGNLDAPQVGDEEMVQVLPAFTNLESLRISGRDWPWDVLYANIRSSLESFAISYSAPGADKLVLMLNDREWQNGITAVTVHHWADTDIFYGVRAEDVKNARKKLEDACAGRSIRLIWITEGRTDLTANDVAYTEADLIP